MIDWDNDDARRNKLIAEIIAEFPGPPRPGDLTLTDIMASTGWTAPTAAYRLHKMVLAGRLETEKCVIDGKQVRVWREPQT